MSYLLKSKDALCLLANASRLIDQGLMYYFGADTILNGYYSIDPYFIPSEI